MIAGSLFSELSVVEIKKASAAPRECVSTVVCYHTTFDPAMLVPVKSLRGGWEDITPNI
ncbi:hypothetical protein DPMN_134395 [Dreissena polymorpha]|uniref:Uncharacterized protein n=1 Tax=Dreissena polymorpha TaxID=45954 RepID=A0A9D4FZN7_DREPO|nr:hypothetical protein DPMN_134395 [Dreissena polymorpha]